jgi:hypothetical protein
MNWNLTVELSAEIVGVMPPEKVAAVLHSAIGNDDYVVTPIDHLTFNVELVDVGDEDVEYIKDITHRQLLYYFDPATDSMVGVEINYD